MFRVPSEQTPPELSDNADVLWNARKVLTQADVDPLIGDPFACAIVPLSPRMKALFDYFATFMMLLRNRHATPNTWAVPLISSSGAILHAVCAMASAFQQVFAGNCWERVIAVVESIVYKAKSYGFINQAFAEEGDRVSAFTIQALAMICQVEVSLLCSSNSSSANWHLYIKRSSDRLTP